MSKAKERETGKGEGWKKKKKEGGGGEIHIYCGQLCERSTEKYPYDLNCQMWR